MSDLEYSDEEQDEQMHKRNLIGDGDSSGEEEDYEAPLQEEEENEQDDDDSPMEIKTSRRGQEESDGEEEEASKRKRKRVRKEMPDFDVLERAMLAKQAREMEQVSKAIEFDSEEEEEEQEEQASVQTVKLTLKTRKQISAESSAALEFAKQGMFGQVKRVPLNTFRSRKLRGKPAIQFTS